jgi:hypothetical protein
MTLTEMLPAVGQLSILGKLKLIHILVEDLETAENILSLEPFRIHDLPTPYDSSHFSGVVSMGASIND